MIPYLFLKPVRLSELSVTKILQVLIFYSSLSPIRPILLVHENNSRRFFFFNMSIFVVRKHVVSALICLVLKAQILGFNLSREN